MMNIFDLTVPQITRTLGNLDGWIARAAKHVEANKLAAERVLNARLAPDQYMFVRQVQIACDNGKFIAGRLAAKEWPSHPDTETTFEQLHARVASVTGYLGTFRASDFEDARERKIVLPWMQSGQWMRGEDYLVQFGLPNFYFHVTTAYSILRHEGIQLGKTDFLGTLAIRA
jgi:hypothetical protein